MTPPIINEAGPLLARYDVLFCDVWGVVHTGRRAHAEAGVARARFRAGGGTVILVSNAPVPAAGVAHILAVTGARCDAFDAIVSSGDIALGHIRDQGYRRLHRVGPLKRDQLFFDGLPGPHAELDAADAIACTGLADERRETVADYRALIDGGLRRGLPFVCANPDLVVDVGHERLVCAGSLAAVYEREGGAVFWAGKPHPSAYGAALAAATRLRGTEPARARILGIGDALRTDMAAAEGFGVDGLFIMAGIHSDDTMRDGVPDPEKLARLFQPATPPAVAAMTGLRW